MNRMTRWIGISYDNRPRHAGSRRFPAIRSGLAQDESVQMSLLTVPSRPRIGAVAQWWVLTCRLIRPSWRNGELVTAVVAPTVFTLGFYVPLNLVMSGYGHGLSSYAQFLMPMIVMQAVAFCATSAAFRAAADAKDGLTVRFGSLPMPAAVPLAARIAAALYRAVVSLAVAVLCGLVIGVRFYGSRWETLGFMALAMLVALALCLGADLIGSLVANPEALTQALIFPQLILGLVSTGLAPAHQFPSWLQGFARDQPVSQFVYGLRALAGDPSGNAGVVGWPVLGPGLAWAVGMLLVFGALGAVAAMRRSG